MDAVTAQSMPMPKPDATTVAPAALTSRWRQLWQSLAPRWPLAIIGIGAFVADLWNLGGPGLWYDEVISADIARQSAGVLLHYMRGPYTPMPNMELYYLLLSNWIGLLTAFGIQPTEFVLRLPSAVFAALGAVVLYQLGNRFFGGRFVGIVAAVLYILNQRQIEAAQELRAYGLELLLVCLLVYTFLEALLNASQPGVPRRTRLFWWGAFVVVGALLPYDHLFGGLVLLSIGVCFVLLLLLPGAWRSSARRSLFWGSGSLLLTAVLLIPAIWQSRHGGDNAWVQPATLHTVQAWLTSLSNGDDAYLAVSAIVLIVGLLASFGRWGKAAMGKGSFVDPGILLLVCWFVITAGVAYALTQKSINLHLFYVRYLIPVAPAWWLAIAVCLYQMRLLGSVVVTAACLVVAAVALDSLHVGLLVVLGVIAAGAVLTLLYERYQRLVLALLFMTLAFHGIPGFYGTTAQQDFRSPELWLQQQYQPGDGIFCFPDYACSVGMEYYLWAYPGPAQFDVNAPGMYSWTKGAYGLHASPQVAEAYAAQHSRIFFIDAPVTNGVSDAKWHAITTWLIRHNFVLADQYASTVNANYPRTVLVQLYVKNPTGP